MNLARALVVGSLALAAGLPYIGVSLASVMDRESTWSPRWKDLAAQAGPRGFVVWESNRTGRWRIFRRELDGSGLRQLIPDEPGYEHYCPHLSPDGTKIVYMSMLQGRHLYWPKPGEENGILHIANALDGSDDRIIAASCRGYYEDRAALWIDDDRLFYIDGDGCSQKLTLSTGERELMFHWNKLHGWFPNATETHISAGFPSFPTYDRETKSVLFRNKLNGCQPWFSRDGVWGFWTKGAGGPIQRYHLATRRATDIVSKNDPRLPESRRYTYFPMLSQCQNLFGLAASFYEHDHFASNYDIFVARIDPFTLELEEDPIRYSFDDGCDRYPDVHFDPMLLGKQRGMAPFVADFADAVDSGWTFDYGDGSPPTSEVRHSFAAPGTYWVSATRGEGERRRGRIRVDPAAGPLAIEARLVNLRQIEVEFDDRIDVDGELMATLGRDDIRVDRATRSATPNLLRLSLDADLRASTTLTIAGGVVGANGLNVRAHDMRVRQRTWPLEPEQLRFAFLDGTTDNRAHDPASGAWQPCTLELHGEALFDRRGALQVGPGRGWAQTDAVAGIAEAVRARDIVMVEAAIEPASLEQQGTILQLLAADGTPALTVSQDRTQLRCEIRPAGAAEPLRFEFGPIRERTHFNAGFNAKWGGVLTAQIDGKTTAHREGAPGHLTDWSLGSLRLGEGWRGAVHHVAIYSAARTNEHVVDGHRSAEAWASAHAPLPSRRLRGRLTAKSPIPTLDEIKPYAEAAVTYEYATAEGKVRAMHWVLLNREPTIAATLQIGDEVDLLLEPLDAHTEVTQRVHRDGLEENFDIEIWHGLVQRRH